MYKHFTFLSCQSENQPLTSAIDTVVACAKGDWVDWGPAPPGRGGGTHWCPYRCCALLQHRCEQNWVCGVSICHPSDAYQGIICHMCGEIPRMVLKLLSEYSLFALPKMLRLNVIRYMSCLVTWSFCNHTVTVCIQVQSLQDAMEDCGLEQHCLIADNYQLEEQIEALEHAWEVCSPSGGPPHQCVVWLCLRYTVAR